MSKILITTGGTGGHIYPALSVADKLKEKGHDIVFIGTKYRMEKDLIPNKGYKFYGLDVIPIKSISGMLKLLKSIFDARNILKEENVDYVIGFGNYISIPSLIAAKTLNKKIYLQEQNVSMGQANRWFFPYAEKVFLAFSETLRSVGDKYKNKFVVTGNPLRNEFYQISKEDARKSLNISQDSKVLVVMGGSLGAKNINEAVKKKIDLFEGNKIIYWATGKELYKYYVNEVDEGENVVVVPYFEDSYNIMAAADLLLCRAGASTISEVIELEKPTILIPYNYVGQKENSEILEGINASKVYTNEEVDIAVEDAIKLLDDKNMLEFMSENIKEIKPGNAVDNISKYFE